MNYLLPLLAALTCSAHAAPLVGAIRWDAWYGADGPVLAVEKSLGPPKYHWRLPWFATVTGEATVKINGDRPEIMAREIEWAATAGLDYWAFVDYGDSGAEQEGHNQQAQRHKSAPFPGCTTRAAYILSFNTSWRYAPSMPVIWQAVIPTEASDRGNASSQRLFARKAFHTLSAMISVPD